MSQIQSTDLSWNGKYLWVSSYFKIMVTGLLFLKMALILLQWSFCLHLFMLLKEFLNYSFWWLQHSWKILRSDMNCSERGGGVSTCMQHFVILFFYSLSSYYKCSRLHNSVVSYVIKNKKTSKSFKLHVHTVRNIFFKCSGTLQLFN